MPDQFRLRWPVDRHVINQRFGEHPSWYAPFGLPGHEGLDLLAPMNASVYAAADGQVYRVGHPPDHPYGLHIRIKHVVGGQTYRTIYAHLAQALVQEGQQVRAGERIALADNTGNSFGAHLHLTLKLDGAQTPGYPAGIIDPLPFLITDEGPPVTDLVVYPTEPLSLRAAPTTNSARLTVLSKEEPLTVLGDAEAARAKIGQEGEWLQVQTLQGQSGYVAAWFVRLTGQAPPESPLRVFPTDMLSVRARPTTQSNRLVIVSPDDPLTVLGDARSARARIGRQGEWLNVRAPSGHVGYVAAWFVRAADAPPATSPPSAFLTLTVYPTADLNLRAQPTINSPRIGGAPFNTPLTVLEDDLTAARAKIGQQDQWLFVQTSAGERGWAAAWFLSPTQL